MNVRQVSTIESPAPTLITPIAHLPGARFGLPASVRSSQALRRDYPLPRRDAFKKPTQILDGLAR